MRIYDVIHKKRNGGILTADEIDFFVQGYVQGNIPDYQISALLMAIYFQGLNCRETADLTLSMLHSGDVFDLSAIDGIIVDKHSTGGVGDKTSLVLIPLVASANAKVAKLSGRGLGHTGGTLDKLESIDGFRIDLSRDAFIKQVNAIGLAIAGQTGTLVPADKKLYALRDVTATVENLSLIASSIMSKKLATGADAIVLDVKVGSGAFMKTMEDAVALSKEMVSIGTTLHRQVVAVISNMDEPLGFAVGNALELKEAIATLCGKGPKDLEELCLTLGSNMLHLACGTEMENGRRILEENLHNGRAFDKFLQWIKAQGGTIAQIENPELLPGALEIIPLSADSSGWIEQIDAEDIGLASMFLGGGRIEKEDTIDHGVGIVLQKKVGDYVNPGETIALLYVNEKTNSKLAQEKVRNAFVINEMKSACRPMVYGIVDRNGFHKK